MRLSEIAKKLKFELVGDDFDVVALGSLNNSSLDMLSYCDSKERGEELRNTKAGAVLITKDIMEFLPKNIAYIVCDNAHLSFAILSKDFANPLFYPNSLNLIHESAYIMPNVHLGSGVNIGMNVTIMSGAFIGDNVKIGDETIIYPNVVLYNNTIIGKNCILHANSVIGSDGFGFAHTSSGEHIKIHHNGWVQLDDDVEIGACTTVDRGVFEPTIIKRGTKIDNLVQIGHNCELGDNCLIVSQSGLAGSTVLGRNVVMGGQSGAKGHLKIGDFAQVAGRGAVTKDLQGGKAYAGHPAIELKEWFKLQAKIARFFKKNS